MKINELKAKLQEKDEKISKATRVRSLLQKQKGLIRSKQTLTDFKEPVLFLVRRDGKMDIYEKATAGKFIFEHSSGDSKFLELRPADQITFDYADRKVRGYVAFEDRPFAGWDDVIIDNDSLSSNLEKIKSTDLKYQERIEALKNKGKLTWVYIIIGLAIAVAIIGFSYMTWIQPALSKRAKDIASITPPVAGFIWLWFKTKVSSKI